MIYRDKARSLRRLLRKIPNVLENRPSEYMHLVWVADVDIEATIFSFPQCGHEKPPL